MTMKSQCPAGSGGADGKKCLTECPTNVKEAIDWVICLTNNTGCHCNKPQIQAADPVGCAEKVAKEVLDIVLKAEGSGDTSLKWAWNEIDMTKDSGVSDKDGKAATYIKGLIDELGKKLASFIGCIDCTQKPCGKCTNGCGLAKVGYTYCYSSASECCTRLKDTGQKGCAKILLGCIPLIFSSLTYLFWNCCDHSNGGKWKTCDLKSGSTNPLCTYLITLGYDDTQLKQCKGSEVIGYLCSFTELSNCLSSMKTTVPSDQKPISYADFINKIQIAFPSTEEENEKEKNQAQGKTMPLQRLYMGASSYFQATQEKHNKKVDEAERPETICELLYWLLGLPYTPVGMQVDTRTLGGILEDYGINSSENVDSCGYVSLEKCCIASTPKSPCIMTLDSAEYYLLPPCYYSAFVLLCIQGKLVSETNRTPQPSSSRGESGSQPSVSTGGSDNQPPDPFLHEVYANQHFNFYYPSSARSWAVMVWDVVYALYFQLGFLYKRCKLEYSNGYGWKNCTYGKDAKCYDSKTWICKAPQSNGAHNGNCGQAPNNCSPLQGYLCDTLTDFTCEKNADESKSEPKSEKDSKSYCTHLKHRPSSQWCPIPMGFKNNMKNLTSERKGEHISVILELYFEEKTYGSSLYQLVLFLGFVSLRPPRCLGDMFAFLCGIGGLCDAVPPQQDKSLDELLKGTISGYPGAAKPEEITQNLKSLAGRCTHPTSSKDTCDSLCSLSPPTQSQCDSCIKYLCPLAWSVYTVFAKESSESYLSWVFYMIDDFESNLKNFLEALKDVECNHGCSACTSKQKCHKNYDTNGCQCDMVKCRGILGALYRFGFTHQDASTVQNSKKCSNFLQQLKKVIDGNPLKGLIKAVNQMLYSIRLAFIFWAWLLWTAAIVYLVFGLVVDLDILHIRSHIWLKHTHNIPAFNLFAARRLKHGIQVYFGR